jgi:hypothetical protein
MKVLMKLDKYKKKEKDPLYTKMDILYIILVPFFIAILFGDEFKVRTGEHYEAIRYIGLLLISSLTITYIKYTMTSESIKRNQEVIDILETGGDDRAELYKAYTDTLKEVQRLTKAVKEKEGIE